MGKAHTAGKKERRYFFQGELTGTSAGPPRLQNRMLQKPDAGIVTAALIIKVVDKGPFLAVGEEDPDHAETA